MIAKRKTAITFPDNIRSMMEEISKVTGKSINSIVTDSCIDYIKEFREDYAFLFQDAKGASSNAGAPNKK